MDKGMMTEEAEPVYFVISMRPSQTVYLKSVMMVLLCKWKWGFFNSVIYRRRRIRFYANFFAVISKIFCF